MVAEESTESKQENIAMEPEPNRGARIAGTAIVAVGVLVLLFGGALAAFFLLAGLIQGNWLVAVGALVALVALLWLGSRLVRVAANQNKKPLG